MPFLKCNDVQLYYEKKGNGPPLILINGLGGDTRTLVPLVEKLVSSCTIVSFDMRGAGQSDKPKDAYTITQIAQDTIALMDQLCGGSAHVMGHSMGGCVAMELALRNPDAVRTLSLVSSFPSWDRPYPPSDELKALFAQTDVTKELLAEVYDTIFGPAFKERIPASEFIEFRMNDPMPQPAYSYLNQLSAIEKFDVCNEVAAIAPPTLIVAGNCDQVVPPNNARWLNEMIPDSELCILKDVGHVVPLEAPKELATLIRNHIM